MIDINDTTNLLVNALLWIGAPAPMIATHYGRPDREVYDVIYGSNDVCLYFDSEMVVDFIHANYDFEKVTIIHKPGTTSTRFTLVCEY